MRRSILTLFLSLLIVWQALAAGGSIAGRVTGKGETEGELLVGATVLLQGTVRGTTTNIRGEYQLSDVPPGTYTLVFSMVGYQRVIRSGIVVTEEKETLVDASLASTPVQVEQLVVTASKRAQSLEEVPVSISVLDASEIRQRNSLTVDDALRYIPGVNMTGFQVNIRGSSGYSRGAGSRVLMLVDGIPFITGDTGELNFESVPAGQVERIEVVKGASSALYGSNALGGVINVITKPIPEVPETQVRTYAGLYNNPTHDQWKWTDKPLSFNGQSFWHARRVGSLGVSLYFSRHIDDGYRLNDYRRRYNVFFKAKEDFSQTSSLTMNFSMLYQYGGQYLYWRSLDSAYYPPYEQKDDNVKSIRWYLSGLYNSVLSENALLTVKGQWYHNDWGFETRAGIGRAESLSDGLRVEATSTIMLDEMHTLTFGVDGNVDIIGADVFANKTIGGLAVYGQDELKLAKPLTLTIGGRFDFQSLGLTESGAQLNPKIALAYNPVAGTTVRASFGQGFRVPSVAEAFISAGVSNIIAVPNQDLKPEKSNSYELGVSQAIGDFATIDVAAFRSDYDNLIEAGLVVSPQNDLQIQWRNVTKARVQGIETGLKLGLFEGALSFNLGYTYVYPQDLSKNDILRYRPRHLFYSNLLARVGFLSAGADFRHVSRVENVDMEFVELGVIPDGDERVEILVSDFRLGADLSTFGIPVTATFNVNNAFQYNYVELIGNLMPPRTYVLVLEARL